MRIFLTLLICMPLYAQAQYKTEINDSFTRYFGFKERGEFHEYAAFFPGELVTMMPEPQLIASITQTFDNPAFSIVVEDGRIDSISDIQRIEQTDYVMVDYRFMMTIRMNEDSFGMFDFILQSLLNTVPEEQIEADVTKGTIVVNQESRMVAIRKPADNWRFMEINPQLIDVAKKIIPLEVWSSI